MSGCLLGKTVATDWIAIQTVLRVDTRLFLSSTQLSNWLRDGPHINVSDFHALIIINLKRFVNNTGRSLDRYWLMRRLAAPKLGLLILSILQRLLINFSVLIAKRQQVFLIVTRLAFASFILVFVKLDRRQQLLFSQQRVDLFDKLQSRVLLIQNQRINRI